MDTQDTSRAGCPREMARQDYARERLNSNAPVFAQIEAHMPGCEACRKDDARWRSENKKGKKRFGIF